MINSVDESQRTAARFAGLAYLLGQAPAIFAEFYVLGRILVYDNAVETARNIMAHERLFRLGIASNLIVFAGDVVLITALCVVLERVNRSLALLATFFRLIETAILVVVTLNDFDVLRLLSGADYLRVFAGDQLAALARLSIGAHGAAYNVGLLFFGVGSSVFSYLWLESGYIPKALAAWVLLASLLIGVCAFAFIIFPEVQKVVTIVWYGSPIFFFEVTMGFWLSFKALRSSEVAA